MSKDIDVTKLPKVDDPHTALFVMNLVNQGFGNSFHALIYRDIDRVSATASFWQNLKKTVSRQIFNQKQEGEGNE